MKEQYHKTFLKKVLFGSFFIIVKLDFLPESEARSRKHFHFKDPLFQSKSHIRITRFSEQVDNKK